MSTSLRAKYQRATYRLDQIRDERAIRYIESVILNME